MSFDLAGDLVGDLANDLIGVSTIRPEVRLDFIAPYMLKTDQTPADTGEDVHTIINRGSSGLNLTQSTGANQATVVAGGGLAFDATDFYTNASIVLTSPVTAFAAYEAYADTGFFFFFDSTNSANRITMYDGNTKSFLFHSGGSPIGLGNGTLPTSGGRKVVAVRYNTTTSDAWVDDTKFASEGAPGTEFLDGLTLGANNAGANTFGHTMYAFRLYDALLSDAEVEAIVQEMGQ